MGRYVFAVLFGIALGLLATPSCAAQALYDAPADAAPAKPMKVSPDGNHTPIGEWEPGASNLFVLQPAELAGGDLFMYLNFYWGVRWLEGRLMIPDDCYSACTFFLGIMPKESVCAAEDAVFGFHGATTDGVYDRQLTEWMLDSVYPDAVQSMLADRGFDGTAQPNDGWVILTREELGVMACP